jgi:hypothetical protein
MQLLSSHPSILLSSAGCFRFHTSNLLLVSMHPLHSCSKWMKAIQLSGLLYTEFSTEKHICTLFFLLYNLLCNLKDTAWKKKVLRRLLFIFLHLFKKECNQMHFKILISIQLSPPSYWQLYWCDEKANLSTKEICTFWGKPTVSWKGIGIAKYEGYFLCNCL